ncbi:ThiF family adenylyltransferase [Kitasatospora cineracea]|uniref:Molybdopterin/thiamine biosynthesis adenylyltransferase n=1 Tax=Kitasatospora cineracea TaxID=88074 RepID=A0A8G1UGD5_9ACTN|nr:ThiF family adenylyltransferase [Kitasatospora cineracea]ROR43495.1 molybdopterin/thiamine biosynthesis adenylyltransferase [Kitasatospora cineracea]
MARRPVNPPATGWSLTIPPKIWDRLSDHVLGSAARGAVLLAGLADGPRGPRLLARELILADEGRDYIPGEFGHRALAPTFVRDAVIRARDEGLAYIAAHAHLGLDHVGFSEIDLASHERGYPSLSQISGQVVGALVITDHAAAGDLWLPDGRREELAETIIPTGNLLRLRSQPAEEGRPDSLHDRQARLLGDLGQETLRRLRVAVVGLGGVGSILVEELARLGVGELVLIDDETVEETNLPRLVASGREDIGRLKTEVAARNARRANPDVRLIEIARRVERPESLEELVRCDWIFLAADGDAARHWVNGTVQQYLVPATQVGVKVPLTPQGDVGQIHTATRLVLPGSGCLWCSRLIDPTRLAVDMHPAGERDAAQYVPGVPAPSVITLNTLAAGEAVNHFVFAVVGLHDEENDHASVIHRPRTRQRDLQEPRQDPTCRWCTSTGRLGLGRKGSTPF